MIKVKAKGVEAVVSNIKKAQQEAKDKIAKELKLFGINTVNKAKILAPVDEGRLRNAINFDFDTSTMTVTISVGVNYAAYVEFGTRKFAERHVSSLPPDWQTFAAQFKGPGGGTFEELVMELTRWVRHKKIGATYNIKTRRRDRVGKQSAKTTAEADAYAIALHIVRNGIRPHPYLYPSFQENKIKLLANLKDLNK